VYDNVNRLLVVDSDVASTALVRADAENLGFAVAVASDLVEFLPMIDDFRPSAILMDMDLPGTDGVEALRALAARACEAQIVLTGRTDRRVLSTTMKLGTNRGLSMCGTLPKPLDAREMHTVLAQIYRPDRRLTAVDIEMALDKKEFIAFYQPKASLVDTGGWQIDGLEALVRWQHPTLGLVMPDEFIPQAEEAGSIGRLTEQVLDQALARLVEWKKDGLSLSCAVNLPPSLVADLTLPDRIAARLTQFGVEPERLRLELTETATMQDPTTTMDILTRLRVKGVGLSIDDFGTGYSSITRLYQMPFDEMKIDKSLVMNVPHSREANMIVSSLIELGHNLGLEICAEGVENRAALDLLEVLSCDRCQGFYLSRAIPAHDIPNFVESWNNQNPASSGQRPVMAVI
jgi:EAL domain-containing protein (putative c-di-GMP-specific phosphodiesterase class I)